MKKLLQRSLSLVLAFVVVFTGLAVTANKAAARQKVIRHILCLQIVHGKYRMA